VAPADAEPATEEVSDESQEDESGGDDDEEGDASDEPQAPTLVAAPSAADEH
jgi:hypothetical protein